MNREKIMLMDGRTLLVEFDYYPAEFDGPFLLCPEEYDFIKVTLKDGQELTRQEIEEIEIELTEALEERRKVYLLEEYDIFGYKW